MTIASLLDLAAEEWEKYPPSEATPEQRALVRKFFKAPQTRPAGRRAA